ncbi:hypothetical protein A2W67_02705 [Candidatus Nomurabacteria bacterium RIFCSPLOWO2_02_40_28]|uniref:Helix-turn-helix domain-containing protein n=2 Tax=Candidatus Nomuraibacteriota TaxID=1752729 RepID=A0A837HU99_9BACT|nr:MAG: helix-turn-helix domain-containing protein [Candidatus Nomurabacteria bacterium GW2011_GWD2_39_12]KKR20393.1 MAG: helix-turn-helix domain-containing protein [Candidatus Nomurabacteria bacterium GW2011_GWC2_39_41]KKR37110.1 MAG: helix-turn-helix domain-containing protein [Candidatus Nomurabacteria bacterium GW2011_GWE2_40_10]KKR38279.1 MAG: helix-turn-helix domain-containing protein [Candidatus Nomurabacteria bacterium GW2011_GWB1_40_11]KKR39835.1 MAG: helix-turn-helix domain-containing 
MVKEEKKYEFIGGNIRKARELSGLSQRQLAEKLGYESSTTVSYIESGERKVSIVDLEKIATLLDRDIRYFIGQPEEQLNVRVALRAETGLKEKDKDAILHIIEMAKDRTREDGGNK